MTALSGLTVIEMCGERGQLIGKLMGDMGARVIKIEPTNGSKERSFGPFKNDEPNLNQSLYFWANNTSKESIAIDIESESGGKIIDSLVKMSDVLLEDFSPGYMDSIGLGYPHLSANNPSLIMTSLSGFGQDGPYKDYESSDLISLALGGIMHSCGYDDLPGAPPIRPSGDHGNYISSHYALIGTLSALFHRDFTGEGQYIDVSAHEACSSTTEAALPSYLYLDKIVFRQTGRHAAADTTPKTLCKTSDGKYVIVFQLFNNLNSWLSLVKWMTEEGMAEDLEHERFKEMARNRSRDITDDSKHAFDVVKRFVSAHTAEEIYRGAQDRRFPWGPVRSPEENLTDPHFNEDRKMFTEIKHPEMGPDVSYTYVGRPYRFKGTEWSATRAPLIGEHTKYILKNDLELKEAEISKLMKANVITAL